MPEIRPEMAIAFRFIKKNWKVLFSTQVPHPIELHHSKPVQKTLILDLDETLIHTLSSFGELAKYKAQSMKVEVVERGEVKRFYVALRPHLKNFLRALSRKYELIIFTSGDEQYANEVVNAIDPSFCYFSQVISRAGCLCVQGRYIKDLELFSNRSLASTIILDNSVISMAKNLENGIYIPSFFGAEDDNELLKIQNFLLEIAQVRDVRPYLAEFSGLSRMYASFSCLNSDK